MIAVMAAVMAAVMVAGVFAQSEHAFA